MRRKTLSAEYECKNEPGHFSGYGSIFGLKDSQGDIVESGAFAESIAKRKPALLWMHQQDKPLGFYKAVAEDSRGLYVEGKLTMQTQLAKEAWALMNDGAVQGMSIGFFLPKGGAETKDGTRHLKKVDLKEISVVTLPACEEARITELKSVLGSPNELERYLRDVGFTRVQAKALLSSGYSALNRRDDADALDSAANYLLSKLGV